MLCSQPDNLDNRTSGAAYYKDGQMHLDVVKASTGVIQDKGSVQGPCYVLNAVHMMYAAETCSCWHQGII